MHHIDSSKQDTVHQIQKIPRNTLQFQKHTPGTKYITVDLT